MFGLMSKFGLVPLVCGLASIAQAGDLSVEESGKAPDKKITVTSPGVYKAVIWQASGGGINEFYDLASDSETKRNLGTAWGLFEVGWHGAALPKDVKPDPSKGDGDGSYGNRFWPTPPYDCKKLQAEGELDVVEKSSARVRVRAQSWFTFWSRYVDKNMPVTAYYTFYPAGQIAVQVRVQKRERRFQWTAEYGPHLHVPASAKNPDADPAFIFSTPKVDAAKDGSFAPAEELVLATSTKLKTALMLTIPAEAHTLFDRHMRHNGRSVNWDRFGYGSNQVVMDPGYDHTWACLVQMGTHGHNLLPPLRTAKDALPFALQYRAPAKIEGAELVKDDAGDFNKDGFNESEGCHVLKGPGPLAFTYERGTGAGFAPAFKVIGWKGEAPRTVKVDGKEVPVVAAVSGGNLVVQILGTLSGDKARIELAARKRLSQLRVSNNHRYLEDASGKPFFLVGDCPQNLPLKLKVAEFDGYMADCQSKGFNWLWICIDGQNGYNPPTKSPVDKQGQRMMNSDWDIGTFNEKYFATIDAIVKSAAQHGCYCAFTPLSECQWSQANIDKNAAENWKKYGLFLGKRYKDAPNIVWMIGNDSINVKAQHAIVEGIKEAGDRHLMSVNWRPGVGEFGAAWVRKHKHGEKWIDLDAWYLNKKVGDGGSPAYWQKIEYERADPMPSFNTEAAYQKPDWHAATDLEIRMMNYSIALGGGCGGHVYGAGWLGDDYDYKTYKDNGGRTQTIHFRKLFAERAWTTLVPDYGHTFITAGFGTLSPKSMDYVAAAMNGGTLGMAYCPKATTIAADLSKFSGPVTARWYDPTNGKFQDIADSPFRNSGSHEFSTPGKNSTADGDWVLVLECDK